MRIRLIIGIVVCLVATVWFLQEIDVLGGSAMSGEGFWALAGAVLLAVGISILIGARRVSRS